eukprot:GHVN01031119.1.p2 GENE.GHVN01031119.1~~GHVN01031119.1.p2  ORF type:complete len:177 (-),score=58.86 GHVN01031119.1:148-678(-)
MADLLIASVTDLISDPCRARRECRWARRVRVNNVCENEGMREDRGVNEMSMIEVNGERAKNFELSRCPLDSDEEESDCVALSESYHLTHLGHRSHFTPHPPDSLHLKEANQLTHSIISLLLSLSKGVCRDVSSVSEVVREVSASREHRRRMRLNEVRVPREGLSGVGTPSSHVISF